MKTKAIEPAVAAWRITMQYRLRNGFVYELEKSGRSVAFHISRDDAQPERSWHVAAHDGRRDEAATVHESAPTRSEALGKVETSWVRQTTDLGLTPLDWDVIANALRAVRAI